MTVGNVRDAPIRLNALLFTNLHGPLPARIQRLKHFYKNQMIEQFHEIIGSADVLGNHLGLFNSFCSGIQVIFYEPYLGFIE